MNVVCHTTPTIVPTSTIAWRDQDTIIPQDSTFSPAVEEDGVESMDSAGCLHPKTPTTKPIPSCVAGVENDTISPLSDPQTSPSSKESKHSEGSVSTVTSVLGDAVSAHNYSFAASYVIAQDYEHNACGVANTIVESHAHSTQSNLFLLPFAWHKNKPRDPQ